MLMKVKAKYGDHDVRVVETVLRALTTSPMLPPLAFWFLVASFQQYLSAISGFRPTIPENDQWLLAQLGIALLLMSEELMDWESGFQVLFCLHTHGIHYVGQPQLKEHTRDLRNVSHCSIALTALNICLNVNNPAGAMQVMRGCNWIKAGNEDEECKRAHYLVLLFSKCIDADMLQDAQKCLPRMLESIASMNSTVQGDAASAGNRLVKKLLGAFQTRKALQVYHLLETSQLHTTCETLSMLLRSLIAKGKDSIACELCQTAIAKQMYPRLAINGNLFSICLPVGLTRLELFYLLEDHLHKVAISYMLREEQLKPLFILFAPGKQNVHRVVDQQK